MSSERARQWRSSGSQAQQQARRDANRARVELIRSQETDEQRQLRLVADVDRHTMARFPSALQVDQIARRDAESQARQKRRVAARLAQRAAESQREHALAELDYTFESAMPPLRAISVSPPALPLQVGEVMHPTWSNSTPRGLQATPLQPSLATIPISAAVPLRTPGVVVAQALPLPLMQQTPAARLQSLPPSQLPPCQMPFVFVNEPPPIEPAAIESAAIEPAAIESAAIEAAAIDSAAIEAPPLLSRLLPG